MAFRKITPSFLKVAIIGTRGIPNAHGGFEQFADNLVRETLWAEENVCFRVYGESPDASITPWAEAVHLPIAKRERPLRYYYESMRRAMHECDVILCCGAGIGILALWPRLMGTPLLLNPDGCEWRRSKWSAWIKLAVQLSYAPAMLAAHRIILDAAVLREDFGVLAGRRAEYIGYQAPEPGVVDLKDATRARFGIHRPYVLVIARLEPENTLLLTIEAMRRCTNLCIDTIIVGPTTTPHYAETLAPLATQNVRFVGGVYDRDVLDQLRGGCLAYIHGHTVGGTNPSLLEALSRVGAPVFCHDNKYNREVAGSAAEYYASVEQLEALVRVAVDSPRSRTPISDQRFTPKHIAERYLAAFRDFQSR
jgi:rhamnosyltransferase